MGVGVGYTLPQRLNSSRIIFAERFYIKNNRSLNMSLEICKLSLCNRLTATVHMFIANVRISTHGNLNINQIFNSETTLFNP